MIIQVFNKYLLLSDIGKTKPLLCGLDNDHPRLFANIDENDNIYLYCLACEYKMIPGIELYSRIEKIVSELSE